MKTMVMHAASTPREPVAHFTMRDDGTVLQNVPVPALREQDLLGIEIQQPKRPPLAETPLNFYLGDEVYVGTHEQAIARARKRAIERDCRQQVCLFTRAPWGTHYWVVQDVR